MTIEKKAKQLALTLVGDDQNPGPLIDVLIEMANWQMQQMLKDAKLAALKDATVAEYWDNWLILDPYLRGSFKDGEKVKIVILKE